MANIEVSLKSLAVGITTPTCIDTITSTIVEPVLIQSYTVTPITPSTTTSGPVNTTYWITG